MMNKNDLIGQSENAVPTVGMGVTELCWTDRHAYTIVEVVSATTLVIQRDNAKRTDSNGMSDMQTYTYTPNLHAPKVTITLRKNGKWHRQGEGMDCEVFLVGLRQEYFDFSF